MVHMPFVLWGACLFSILHIEQFQSKLCSGGRANPHLLFECY